MAQIDDAIAAHQQGRLPRASTLYDEVLAEEPGNVRALRLRGVLARQLGDLGASIRLLETATRLAPRDVTAANDLALSLIASGDLHAAEAALRRALDIAPESPRALANLGALLQQRGHLAESIAVHRACLEVAPDDLEVRCNLANALMDAGRGEESLAACDAALSMAPHRPLVLATKGAVLVGLERWEAAVDVLTRALDPNPVDDMALVNLACAQRALGDLAAATESLTRAAGCNPGNARATADLGNVWLARGRADRAIDVCRSFLAAHPGERLVLATYACALRESGRISEARRLLDFENLVRVRDVAVPDGFADLDEFNRKLADFVTTHPSLTQDPVRKSTRGGAQTGELSPLESPLAGALEAMIRSAVEATVDELLGAGFGDHEVMAYAADRWALRTWGTVLTAGGRQSPHLHPLGWLSGVYYVGLPGSGSGDAGDLEFGRVPERLGASVEPETLALTPRVGRLVIFPSWFYHRTLPFDTPGTRVSVAFDVMPLLL